MSCDVSLLARRSCVRSIVIATCLIAGNTARAFGQTADPLSTAVADLAGQLAGRAGTPSLSLGADGALLAPIVAIKGASDTAVSHAVANGAAAANDKQTGASSTGGSKAAGLTTKGLGPDIFGLAVENGVLTQSTSGSTVTFTGNPHGIIAALAGKGFFQTRGIDGFANVASIFSFSTSFSGATASAASDSTSTKWSQYAVHVELINHRDPRRNTAEWNALFGSVGNAFDLSNTAVDLANFTRLARSDTALTAWIAALNASLAKLTRNDAASISSVITKQIQALDTSALSSSTLAATKTLVTSLGAIDQATQKIVDAMKNNLLMTFVFTGDRPATGPTVSTGTLVVERGSRSRGLTLNASASLLNGALPLNVTSRWRDMSLTGQVDQRLAQVNGTGALTFAIAGQLEHLHQDPSQPTPTAAAGNIATMQMKLSIPLANGVALPLSFTVANRSELVKERLVRGQFGVTFSFDSLLAALKPGTPPVGK